jgi:DNA-3-methyladenine glycosylase
MYCCLNFVTEPEGRALRGAHPGIVTGGGTTFSPATASEHPRRADGIRKKELLNGPGKLCRALSLTPGAQRPGPHRSELYDRDAPETGREILTAGAWASDYAEEAVFFPWRNLLSY